MDTPNKPKRRRVTKQPKLDSELNRDQLRYYVKLALRGIVVESIYKVCKNTRCNGSKTRYKRERYKTAVCRVCNGQLDQKEFKTPTVIKYKCDHCNHTTQLTDLRFIGYFICLNCYERKPYGEKCELILSPMIQDSSIEDELFTINQQANSLVVENIRGEVNLLYSKDGDYHSYFNPSLSIHPWSWSQYIKGKLTILTIDIFQCGSCYSWQEDNYLNSSLCITCNTSSDTSSTSKITIHSSEVYFQLRCPNAKCEITNDLREWVRQGFL